MPKEREWFRDGDPRTLSADVPVVNAVGVMLCISTVNVFILVRCTVLEPQVSRVMICPIQIQLVVIMSSFINFFVYFF